MSNEQAASSYRAAGVRAVVDALTSIAAMGFGAGAWRGQCFGFMVAAVLVDFPKLYAFRGAYARRREAALGLRLLVMALLVYLLRIGVFAMLHEEWAWPGPWAAVPSAMVTAALLRFGYEYSITQSWSLDRGAGWRPGAVGLIAFALALRIIYGGQVELMPEETYYWNYSQHLDIGYLDHPPMVAWLIKAGTLIFGNTAFGVRSPAICTGLIATFFVCRTARDLFGDASALVAAVLMQLLPFFFLTGLLITPDAPLMAAWAAAVYFLQRALIAGRSEAWWRAGLCLGLGLLSKYTIALLGASTFIFMLADPRARVWLRRVQPYGAAMIAAAVFAPVVVWNAQHEWASFAFQTSRRLASSPRFALHKLVGSVLVLLTPTGFVAATALLGRPPGDDSVRGWRFIQITMVVPLAVFAAFSLRHEVKLDWTGAPWVAAVPALAYVIVGSGELFAAGWRAWTRRAWVPTWITLLLLYGGGLYHLAVGIPGVGYGKHAELVPVGWRELGRQVSRVADGAATGEGRVLIVGMDRYAIASELAFYGSDTAKSVAETSSGHLFGQMGLMYERWFPTNQQLGRSLLLVAWSRGELEVPGLESSVDRLGPIQQGDLMRDQEFIRHYYYRFAHGYRGLAGG